MKRPKQTAETARTPSKASIFGGCAIRPTMACIPCRKSWKTKGSWEHSTIVTQHCPECGLPGLNMGRSFKPPRRESKDWTKLAELGYGGFIQWKRRNQAHRTKQRGS